MAWLGTTRVAKPWLATARFDPGLPPRLEDESGCARQLKHNEIRLMRINVDRSEIQSV